MTELDELFMNISVVLALIKEKLTNEFKNTMAQFTFLKFYLYLRKGMISRHIVSEKVFW